MREAICVCSMAAGALNWLGATATSYVANGMIDLRCQALLDDVMGVVWKGGVVQFGYCGGR